jgi:hypothetical protein
VYSELVIGARMYSRVPVLLFGQERVDYWRYNGFLDKGLIMTARMTSWVARCLLESSWVAVKLLDIE